MNFRTGQQLLALCEAEQMTITEVMKRREQELFPMEQMQAEMLRRWEIMKAAAVSSIEEEHRTMGGLIGGEARKLDANQRSGGSVCGSLLSRALTYSMGVLEVNASMGLIVAAPTAGSSGVIPGVFLALQEEKGFSDEKMADALFHAGAVGYLISYNATVSGAEGGCQAEVGSASAMAASAVTELMGGSPKACLDAASTALINVLGMACDPIAGLVEAPCQKRNGLGVSNALISAEMSLAGIESLIPFDEAVHSMYQVGRNMPEEIRETAMGGAAATKTGCEICKRMGVS